MTDSFGPDDPNAPQVPPQQPWVSPPMWTPPPSRQQMPPPGPPGPPPGPPPWNVTPSDVAIQPASPERPAKKRTWLLVPAAVAAVIAVAVVVFVIRGAGGDSGGAATPDAAVRDAIAAVAQQDVAKTLSMVNPDELKTFGALLDAMRQRLSDTGLISASGIPEPWLHMTTSNVRLSTRKVTDDLAFVRVTGGSASATIEAGKLPKLLQPAHPRTSTHTTSLASQLGQVTIAVVNRGGRWYLSPTTTLLENIRQQLGLPAPDFANPMTIDGGASSPAGVLPGLIQRIQAHDFAGAAGYLSTSEVPALRYYVRTFGSEITQGLSRLDGRISNLDTTVQGMSNGLQKVVINSFDVEGSVDGEHGVTGQYRNGCVSSDRQARPRCVSDQVTRLTGLSDAFVVVENDAGKWRISPVATVLEYARILLTDGNKDAFLRLERLEPLAAVTQTVPVGSPQAIKLNDGGFAHITVTGQPGTCVEMRSENDVEFGPDIYTGGRCVTQIPASGKVNGVVYGEAFHQTTVEVRFVPE